MASPPAIWLHPLFDSCVLSEPILGGGRFTYSTDAMERTPVHVSGWDPEEARQFVARMSTILTHGWPDFLD